MHSFFKLTRRASVLGRYAMVTSGGYNGLAKKHVLDLRKGKVMEHEVIVYCKANPDKRIIDAIAVVFKVERQLMGIEMK